MCVCVCVRVCVCMCVCVGGWVGTDLRSSRILLIRLILLITGVPRLYGLKPTPSSSLTRPKAEILIKISALGLMSKEPCKRGGDRLAEFADLVDLAMLDLGQVLLQEIDLPPGLSVHIYLSVYLYLSIYLSIYIYIYIYI